VGGFAAALRAPPPLPPLAPARAAAVATARRRRRRVCVAARVVGISAMLHEAMRSHIVNPSSRPSSHVVGISTMLHEAMRPHIVTTSSHFVSLSAMLRAAAPPPARLIALPARRLRASPSCAAPFIATPHRTPSHLVTLSVSRRAAVLGVA